MHLISLALKASVQSCTWISLLQVACLFPCFSADCVYQLVCTLPSHN